MLPKRRKSPLLALRQRDMLKVKGGANGRVFQAASCRRNGSKTSIISISGARVNGEQGETNSVNYRETGGGQIVPSSTKKKNKRMRSKKGRNKS